MIRWRCQKRACTRKLARRVSTETKQPVPPCPGCGQPMTIDHYRTSRKEKRARNCNCSVVEWAPHDRKYCKKREQREYEDSFAEPNSPETAAETAQPGNANVGAGGYAAAVGLPPSAS